MPEYFASLTSFAPSATVAKPNCMFDCPAQTQISPTSTLLTVMVVPESTCITAGSEEAFSGSRRRDHPPSAPVVVIFFWPAKETETAAPGVARPQTATGTSRCKTMLSVNSEPTCKSAALPAGLIVVKEIPLIKSILATDNRHAVRERTGKTYDAGKSNPEGV